MNHKEKLIEIINNVIRCDKCGIVPEWLAEDLIFYGVTVQELNGRDFCQKFDFAGARAEVNKYGAHISLGVCSTKFPNKEQFKFCPMCGRKLPEPPKGEKE